MKINPTKIPSDSFTATIAPADYTDSFYCEINSIKNVSPDDLMVSFWTNYPWWVKGLFTLRDWLVKPFGLQGDNGKMQELEQCIREGKDYKFITVVNKNARETVIVLKEKHLDAYMSVIIQEEGEMKKIFMSTVVKFNNTFGHIYFFFIKPFHGLIVRAMLKNSIKLLFNL